MRPPKALFSDEHPDLLEEWDFKRNKISPQMIGASSPKKVFWICDKGHSYEASIQKRAKGQGCPYCSGRKVLAGFNDLATLRPDLAAQWDKDRNGDLTPADVTLGMNKKVFWKCRTCGNCWEAVISNRVRKETALCPVCGRKIGTEKRIRRTISQKGSFADLHPDLLDEWDYERNNAIIFPTDATAHSNVEVFWKCRKCGHKWKCSISQRSKGSTCLKCSYKTRQKKNISN